jgi:sodium transport system permease protein
MNRPMNHQFHIIKTVAKKELTDHFRDRRTTLLVLLLSIALGPLMLIGMGYFFSNVEKKFESREVYVEGIEHAPEIQNFLQRQDMKIKAPDANFRELIKQGKHDAVMMIPKSFSTDFLTGEVKVELIYDDTRQSASNASIRVLRSAINGFNQEVAGQRLIVRGISPAILRPVEIENINMGNALQRAAALLFIIPWITLIGCVSGAISMAIDLGAGERERGSLEPLLMNPVERLDLVLGKALAVSVYTIIIALLTLLGFAVTLKFGGALNLSFMGTLSFTQYAIFFGMIATFGPAMSVVMVLVATYGRTFKEGQTYASYALQLVMLLPVVSMLGEFKDATWQLFVPVLAQLMVITRVLRGEVIEPIHYLLPMAINVAIFVASVILMAKLLRREKIIFGRA